MGSEKRFGYEWSKYDQLDENYELQFQKWIAPFKPEIFKDKKVLDAGCGMGRNSFWALKYGAKEVVAFDFDQRSLAAARQNLAQFKNVRIDFQSIYQTAYENEFDLAFSIGVIHHLAKPDLAIENLVKAVKPGGLILIWVYGYENNQWIVKYISPLRKHIFSKLPVSLLHFLSYIPSFSLYLYTKIFSPKSPYLKQLAQFKFSHLHSIVFDQLLPEIADYYKKEQAYNLLAKHDLKDIQIAPVNQNSWAVSGYKKV